jgi:ABC-2 type transport system permease protein
MINTTIRGFIKKEFLQALRDPRMKILLFVMPVIQLSIFGIAISTEVKNIRLSTNAVYSDTVAYNIYKEAMASGWFKDAGTTTQDPFLQIQNDETEAVIVVPKEGLTKAINNGEGNIQLLINSTNMLRARSIELYLRSISSSVLAKLYGQRGQEQPMNFNVRVLYNPSMISSIFLVPGVMCMIVCLLSIILTSMALAKEKEQGTFEMLISAPVKPWEIIVGKTLPYFILGISNIPLIILTAVLFFSLPVRGPIWIIALTSVIFVATTVCIGMLISTFAKDQQQGMLGGFLFLFPAIMLSGVMFPLDNMPLLLKIVAYLNPLTYFVAIMRNVLLKGGDPYVIVMNTAALIVIAVVTMEISLKRFKSSI